MDLRTEKNSYRSFTVSEQTDPTGPNFYGALYLRDNYYQNLSKSFKQNNRCLKNEPCLLLKKYMESLGYPQRKGNVCLKTLYHEFPAYNLKLLRQEERFIFWLEDYELDMVIDAMHQYSLKLLNQSVSHRGLLYFMEQFSKCLGRTHNPWGINTRIELEDKVTLDLSGFLFDDKLTKQYIQELTKFDYMRHIGLNVVPSDFLQLVLSNGNCNQDYEQYEFTIDAYRRVFQQEPPSEIWHPVSQRHNKGKWVSLYRLMLASIKNIETGVEAEKAYAEWTGETFGCNERYTIRLMPVQVIEEHKFDYQSCSLIFILFLILIAFIFYQ